MDVYVWKLSKFVLSCCKRRRVETLYYEEGNCSVEADILIKEKNFGTHPHLFVTWNEYILCAVRDYLTRYWKQERKDSFVCFLSSFLCRRLSFDFRLLVLSEDSTGEKAYQFQYPSMMKCFISKKDYILNTKSEFFHTAKNNMKCILAIVFLVFKYFKALVLKKKPIAVKYFVVPYYQKVIANTEFFTFHNAIEDAAVLVDEGSELCQFLKNKQEKRVVRQHLYIKPKQALSLVLTLVNLSFKVMVSHRKLLVMSAVFQYVREKAIILSYFNAVIPTYVCVIRGDMYGAATLLRELSNQQKIKTISFSHSSYYYPEYYLAAVDFDYFGISGRRELEVYQSYWNHASNYIVTGQMTVDAVVNKSKVLVDLEPHLGPSIGCFPTTLDVVCVPHQETSFNEFIQAVVSIVSSVDDSFLYYKSKSQLKMLREDPPVGSDLAITSIFETHLVDSYTVLHHDVTVYDVYAFIDVGFVYSMSTCAFELMQRKQKVVVFLPFDKTLHPFYMFTPLLVASSFEEFVENAMAIIVMSSEEYMRYIEPTLDYCLSDDVSDNLANKFVEAIEAA
jgi:hypothetical protein